MQCDSLVRLVRSAGALYVAGALVASQGAWAQSTAQDSLFDQESYTHYPVRRCVAAMNRHAGVFRIQLDTTAWTPSKVRVNPNIRDVARQCWNVGRWRAATTDPRELLSLLHVDLVLGDTADANAVIARSFALGTTPQEQAKRALKFLDVQLWYPPLDWDRMNAIFDRIKTLPAKERANALVDGYSNLLIIALSYHAMEYSRALRYLDSVNALAPQLDSLHKENAKAITHYVHVMNWADEDSVMVDGRPFPVPQFDGKVIAGAPGPYPIPGKITVLIVSEYTGAVERAIFSRRITERFGDTATVMFVRKTQGYLSWSPRLSFDEEGALMRDFYADSIKATGGILLEKTPMHFRPAPDGRRVYDRTHNDSLVKVLTPPEFAELNPPFGGFAWMVVNSSGNLQNAGLGLDDYSQLQVARSIERAIARMKNAAAKSSQ